MWALGLNRRWRRIGKLQEIGPGPDFVITIASYEYGKVPHIELVYGSVEPCAANKVVWKGMSKLHGDRLSYGTMCFETRRLKLACRGVSLDVLLDGITYFGKFRTISL